MPHKNKKSPTSEPSGPTPREKKELKQAVDRDQAYSKRILKSLRNCPCDRVTLLVTGFQDMFSPVRRPKNHVSGVPMTSHLIFKNDKVALPGGKNLDELFRPEWGVPLFVKVVVKDQLAPLSRPELASATSCLNSTKAGIKKARKQLKIAKDRRAKTIINAKIGDLKALSDAIATMFSARKAAKKNGEIPEYYPIGVAFRPKHDGDKASVAAIKKAASLCKSAKPYLLGEQMYVTFTSSLVTKHLSKYAVMIQRGDASIGVIDPGVPSEF